MNLLVNTLANGTGQFLEAAAAVAIRVVPVGPVGIVKARPAQLDRRTLQDIGVEPGSITWMR